MPSLSRKFIQPSIFLSFLTVIIIFLYFIIPPRFLNYPLVEFLKIITNLFNFSIEFEEYNNTFLVFLPSLVFQLSNEISGFIFYFFIILFCIFSTIKLKDSLILSAIFLPINFFLNAFRVLLIYVLSFDINSFDFYDIFFGFLYYILIFALFFHYILFKFYTNPINLFNFRFLQKKRNHINQVKIIVNKSKLIKGFALLYLIISSLFIIVISYGIFYEVPPSDSYVIDIDRYYKPPRMVRINNTFYFIWDSEHDIKIGTYSINDSAINSKILTQKNPPYQYYSNPFIQFDYISKNFIITGICQYSGYIGDSWMRIKDEIKINQTELLNSNLRNGINLRLSNEETELFNNIPPSPYRFIYEYYFTLDKTQNPIFFVNRGGDIINVAFSYDLTNSLTFFNGESSKYRVCTNNLNETYFFFKSEDNYYYSLIKNNNFSSPQRLSNLIEISNEADQLNIFCDSSNVLHFTWIENQTKVFLTSNETGSFRTPQLLYNSNIHISNPTIKFLDNGIGYMTFCDENYKIYFFEINNSTIIFNHIFQDEGSFPKPFVFPDLEINPDKTISLFWRRILRMEYTISQSKNDIALIHYLGNGNFSNLIYIN